MFIIPTDKRADLDKVVREIEKKGQRPKVTRVDKDKKALDSILADIASDMETAKK